MLIAFGNSIIAVSIVGAAVLTTMSTEGLTKTLLHDGGDKLYFGVIKENDFIRLKLVTNNDAADYPVTVVSLRQGWGVIGHWGTNA